MDPHEPTRRQLGTGPRLVLSLLAGAVVLAAALLGNGLRPDTADIASGDAAAVAEAAGNDNADEVADDVVEGTRAPAETDEAPADESDAGATGDAEDEAVETAPVDEPDPVVASGADAGQDDTEADIAPAEPALADDAPAEEADTGDPSSTPAANDDDVDNAPADDANAEETGASGDGAAVDAEEDGDANADPADTGETADTGEAAVGADTAEEPAAPDDAPTVPLVDTTPPQAAPGTGGTLAECGLDRLVIYAGARRGGVGASMRNALVARGFGAGCAAQIPILAANCPVQFSGRLGGAVAYDPNTPYVAAGPSIENAEMQQILFALGFENNEVSVLDLSFADPDDQAARWMAIVIPPSFEGWESVAASAGLGATSQSLCGPTGRVGS